MGRYYRTDNGAEGKFMFGVQPSDDPAEMGMHEQDPQVINYYADEDDGNCYYAIYENIGDENDEDWTEWGYYETDFKLALRAYKGLLKQEGLCDTSE